MNDICPTVHALVKHIFKNTDNSKTTFSYSQGHKICRSVKISRSIRILVHSHNTFSYAISYLYANHGICPIHKMLMHPQNTVLNNGFWFTTESTQDRHQNIYSVCKWPAQHCYNGLYDWCCIQQWPEFVHSCWRRICEVIFLSRYMAWSNNFWIVFFLCCN